MLRVQEKELEEVRKRLGAMRTQWDSGALSPRVMAHTTALLTGIYTAAHFRRKLSVVLANVLPLALCFYPPLLLFSTLALEAGRVEEARRIQVALMVDHTSEVRE